MMATATASTASSGSAPASASGAYPTTTMVASDRNMPTFESYRKMGSIAGKIQLPFALLGLVLSFGYVNAALAVASASIAMENWKSEENARSHFFNRSRSGCDAVHLKGVCIAGIVFALIETVALALAWPVGLLYLALAEALGGSGIETTLRWVGLCIILTPILAVLQLVLFTLQIVSYDAMRRAMPPVMLMQPSAVVMPQQVPHGSMHPHMMYAMPQQGGMQYQPGQPMPQGAYGQMYPSQPGQMMAMGGQYQQGQQPIPAYVGGWAAQGQPQGAPPGMMQVPPPPPQGPPPPAKSLD